MHLHVGGTLLALSVLASSVQANPPEPPSETAAPRPRVVLLRGGLGVFSRGLDVLADRCRAEGMSVSVHSYTLWSNLADQLARETAAGKQPLVLIGHSFGADAVLSLASRLQLSQTTVDLAVTLESVNTTQAPSNIRTTLNLYCPKVAFSRVPLWRGLPLYGNGQNVENINVRERPDVAPPGTAHGSIDDSPQVHQFIIERIQRLNGKVETAPAASAESPPQATPPPAAATSGASVSYLRAAPATVEVPPLRGSIDEPLQITGPAPAAAESRLARPDGAYSPTALLQDPGSARVPVQGQSTSRPQ